MPVSRKDGEWFHVEHEGHSITCCDCGLTHTIRPRVRKGKVHLQAFRDRPATRVERRRRGVSVKRKAA